MDNYERPSSAGRAAAARYLGPEPHGPGVGRRSTFAVTATSMRAGKRSRGRGELLISPGAVVFAPFDSYGTSVGASELVHTGRDIVLTTAVLRPPWGNTYLLLTDKRWYVRARISTPARRKLRRALRESGASVRNETSWHPPALPVDSLAGRSLPHD